MKNLLKLTIVVCLAMAATGVFAQGISVYQYRHVPQDKLNEFIERETKYWSVVAQKAIDNGKLTFWGLFVKQGVYDAPNTSNVLFINGFKDIDDTDGIWDAKAVFPDVPMEKMSTFDMGYVTSMLYVKSENFESVEGANPDKDYNYVTFVYHNSTNPGEFIALEKEHWAPFIKSAMDSKKTTQVAWGNNRVLAPTGPEMPANTISFDIYPSLKEALDTSWAEDVVFPQEGIAKLRELYREPPSRAVYQRIKVVNTPTEASGSQ
jgi:hypothetical protein